MPQQETFKLTITGLSGDNDSFQEESNFIGTRTERSGVAIPAAKAGVLTTRTDDNTGTFTMDAGHGFVSTDEVDFFWTIAGVNYSRRGMVVTMTGDSAAADGGSGDALPPATTAITAMKPVEYPFTVDGDEALVVAVRSEASGWVVFVDDGPADIAEATFRINVAGRGKTWTTDSLGDNPLAGDAVTAVKFSHGSASPQFMKAYVLVGPAQ